ARRLVRDVGGRFFEIPEEQKELYHAAAVLASGGLAALLSISLEILGRCGLGEKEARRVLLPLVERTIANIESVGPAGAMAGPVRRGDLGTIRRNTRALAGVQPDWARIYKLLAQRSIVFFLNRIRRVTAASGTVRRHEMAADQVDSGNDPMWWAKSQLIV